MLSRSTRLARPQPHALPRPTSTPHRQTRTYADDSRGPDTGEPGGRDTSTSRVPLMVVGGILLALPGYYIFNSNKSPGSGQAAQKQVRGEGDPSKEIRDARDSPVKTLEDKRRKEQGGVEEAEKAKGT